MYTTLYNATSPTGSEDMHQKLRHRSQLTEEV